MGKHHAPPDASRYAQRGVSAGKEEVHAAVAQEDPGLYPGAFCKIVPDHLSGDPQACLAMHADGAGTKASLAYIQWRETGDLSVFRGLAQDALVMNLDDLLCVGAQGPFMLSNTIGRNKGLVPGEVIAEILAGYRQQAQQLAQWGVELIPTGGETADLGDLVRTLLVDSTLVCRMKRNEVVDNQGVQPGDVILGVGSAGQAAWESAYNSGIGSNGLTAARHDLLKHPYHHQYPESADPALPHSLAYTGPFRLEDPLAGSPLTVGQALLSPTRTHAPLLVPLLRQHRGLIGALVHCTGGGQTKTLRAGQGMTYVKDNLFPPPPVFAEIQRVTQTPWREMYQVFNMGHRMEIIGRPALVPLVQALAQPLGLEVRVVGACHKGGPANQVVLHTPGGVETYPG
ncbi:MAG: AIR synthase-related protein [Deltaproteobacteria bacterium]|nr:AIR synthase-related protein [Deltaproteobacteria bacterium]